ncbi:MAG: hypothetical protein BZ151_13255 [Desulfobacca sp. 4484_104]|nr:MAG: hypothetical protein BZ151_13255 [Desulfobacca sp. 4484_104]
MSYAHPSKPHLQAVDIQQIVTQSLEAVNHRAAFTNITLKNKLPENLPPVQVDSMQIGQVLINLLINAEQAMPDGGSITIAGHEENDCVVLQVADTGQGIPPEQQTVIFDPFFTTREAGKGTNQSLPDGTEQRENYGFQPGWLRNDIQPFPAEKPGPS